MKTDLIGEVLARLADHVPGLEPQEMARDWEQNPAFVELARQLKAALSPVEPAAAFRQRLERELLPAWRVSTPPQESPPLRSLLAHKRFVLGAAAVGSVASAFSILGLVLLVVRRRLTARPAHQEHGGLAV